LKYSLRLLIKKKQHSYTKENLKARRIERALSQNIYLEEFTQELKAAGIIYYYGIDGFLDAYKKAVYGCLKNIEED